MSNLKTHLATGPVTTACGIGRRTSTTPSRVDCRNCQNTPAFGQAKNTADAAIKAAFDAQEPRQFKPQFGRELVCECGSDLFRYKGRSCYGHYDDYVCAACGKETSRITETGMSF